MSNKAILILRRRSIALHCHLINKLPSCTSPMLEIGAEKASYGKKRNTSRKSKSSKNSSTATRAPLKQSIETSWRTFQSNDQNCLNEVRGVALYDLKPIGTVQSTVTQSRDMPLQGVPAVINVFDEFLEGLTGIESDTHINVIGWFDKADRAPLMV